MTKRQRDGATVERACSQCGEVRPLEHFAVTRTVNGRDIKRAQCRDCYNAHRREHYAKPAVNALKRAKRLAYESRPDVRRRLDACRSKPETRERERRAVKAYRAKPQVAAFLRTQRAAYRGSLQGRAVGLLNSAALRARKRNLPFEIDLPWVQERLEKNACAVTGIAFQLTAAGNQRRRNPFAPSIDQIRAGHGYTKDNSRIVLASVNNALGEWGDEHLMQLAAALLRVRGWLVEPPINARAAARSEEMRYAA